MPEKNVDVFSQCLDRRQNEHHGRETEEKQTRANVKHHFSCTKYMGWICWGKQTRVTYEIASNRGQKQVCLQFFLVWSKYLFSSPLPSSPSVSSWPTTSSLPSWPWDNIYRKSCRSSRPIWYLYYAVVHFVELCRHWVKLTFQKSCSSDCQSFCHVEALKLFFALFVCLFFILTRAWAFKVIFHSDDYGQLDRQRKKGFKIGSHSNMYFTLFDHEKEAQVSYCHFLIINVKNKQTKKHPLLKMQT